MAESNRFLKLKRDGLGYGQISTPLGPLFVAMTRRGFCRVSFRKSGILSCIRDAKREGRDVIRVDRLPAAISKSFKGYFRGEGSLVDLPVDLRDGTAFMRRVWLAIRAIPQGETRSYGWIARRIGGPRASRAVGTACGANPVPILIPCHRVVRSDGGLGGFTGGLALKRRLLGLENAIIEKAGPGT